VTRSNAQRERVPFLARWLLRLSPVHRESRDEVGSDLAELFATRRSERGVVYAHWRLYRDIASLWVHSPPATGARPHHPARASLALLRDAVTDLRYAVRLFARQPGILLLTIVGLSLGLGIATAAFSIMNVAALRGDGLVDPGRAPGVLRVTESTSATVWRYDEFERLREGATHMQLEAVMTSAAAASPSPSPGEADAPSAAIAFVSGGFFAATGGRTTIGRPLEAADEQPTGPPAVVVSFAFWTSRLNRDPDVIGRRLRIGYTSATIVGVAERRFSLPSNRVLWMPLTAYGAVYDPAPTGRTPDVDVQVFGRLSRDASLSEAEAQLSGVAAALSRGRATGEAVRVRLDTHAGLGRVPASDTLTIVVAVFAVIGLMLLLACANVATVLVSTAITREREMGVRAALGAARGRIVRQLVTESLALGVAAALIGLMCAGWAIPVIAKMIEAPAGVDLAPDLRVYLFLGIVTLVTGVGAGLAPAWHGRGADLVSPLKGDGARDNRVAPRRLRSMLVMTQAAISVLLIVMSTLFVRAAFRVASIDVGFDASGLYAIAPGLGPRAFANDGAGIRNFWARAIPELQALPGVAAVTLSELTPFDGITKSSITREEPARVIHFNRTSAGYFDAVGLRILTGRTFRREEAAAGSPVAVVSQSVARAYWPERSPLGEVLPREIPIPPSMAELKAGVQEASARPVVIGVVADAITAQLHEQSALTVYEPLDPASEVFAQLMIRVAPGTTGVVDQARHRLRSIDPQAEVTTTSVATLLQREADRPRMLATLTGVIGSVAIILCVIGLYGLTASVVAQRTREMGVRLALGAERRDLLRLLLWDSLRPVVLGLAIGAGSALLASRVVAAAMLFGVSPQDPIAYASAAAVLLVAATLAVSVPTRRATRVDAALVLRQS
jgi:predicted permease